MFLTLPEQTCVFFDEPDEQINHVRQVAEDVGLDGRQKPTRCPPEDLFASSLFLATVPEHPKKLANASEHVPRERKTNSVFGT